MALASLLVPAALMQEDSNSGMFQDGWTPDEMYHVVKVTSSSDSAVNFDILATAVKDKDGKVAVMPMDTPLSGAYYFTNDTAVIPLADMTEKNHPKLVTSDYDNATIGVAGASAVVVMKNLAMTDKGDSSFEIEFGNLGVYLPDGTTKAYELSAPGKAVRSPDSSLMLIVGNPSVRSAIQDALASGSTFPLDAKPVMLSRVDGVK